MCGHLRTRLIRSLGFASVYSLEFAGVRDNARFARGRQFRRFVDVRASVFSLSPSNICAVRTPIHLSDRMCA